MNNFIQPPDLEENCPYVQDNCPDDAFQTNRQSQLNIARKDKFLIVLAVPCVLKPYLKENNRFCNPLDLERLQLTIWGYVVPKVAIESIDVDYSGQTAKVSGLSRPSYQPLTVNFTVDNEYKNYFLLWSWLNLQNDEKNGVFDGKGLSRGKAKGILSDYSTTFSVIAMDEYDKPVAMWTYIGAYPTELGEIKVEYRNDGNSELESSISFEFFQMRMKLLPK